MSSRAGRWPPTVGTYAAARNRVLGVGQRTQNTHDDTGKTSDEDRYQAVPAVWSLARWPPLHSVNGNAVKQQNRAAAAGSRGASDEGELGSCCRGRALSTVDCPDVAVASHCGMVRGNGHSGSGDPVGGSCLAESAERVAWSVDGSPVGCRSDPHLRGDDVNSCKYRK